MTTVPTSPAMTAQPRPAAAGVGPASSPAGTIDPVKLLKKHKWLLAISAVAGAAIGVGAHFALAKLYPIWRPVAIFECLPPMTGAGIETAPTANEQEMSRFMQTQARVLTSDQVLARVAEDPQLRELAPQWSQRFVKTGGDGGVAFDNVEALEELRDTVGSRVIAQTNLIELSAAYQNKYDAKAILQLTRQKYFDVLSDQGQALRQQRTSALRDQVTRLEQDVNALQLQREGIIRTESVDSIDDRKDATSIQLAQVTETLLEVDQKLQAGNKQLQQLEAELNSPTGPTFSDELRDLVDVDPLVLDIKRRKNELEALLQSMRLQGIGPGHRDFIRMQANIDGTQQNLEETTNRLLRQRFDGQVDTIRKGLEQFRAQLAKLESEREIYQRRLNDLTRVQARLRDIETEISNKLDIKASINADLQSLIALTNMQAADRVITRQEERIPTDMSFPKLQLMIPAGLLLSVGLIGGIVFLREVADQRVKSPADVALIPRTRLLGWIPDASEDPQGQGTLETALRDRPKGVVAESFRQLRSSIAKRTESAGHKTFLVLAGMPGSGGSTVACNLALALAATDRRVLLIDANFRRAAIHRIFAAKDAPGLSDVLAGDLDLAAAVQATSSMNLSILSAGSKEQRIYERLGGDAMGELLAAARKEFDAVIIDTAPVIVAGDGMSLAQRCDATLLVVRAMQEKRGLIARVRNELTETRGEFLGVVVNGVKSAAGGYIKSNIQAAQEYQQA